ncbi:synaptobrevin homolog YKT6-like isoform X2 [Lineus longissimus]
MVKLFCLTILYKRYDGKVQKFASGSELASFGYFQRNSVQEFMDFTSKIIAERTQTCSRETVKEQEYLCHVYVRSDNLCGVLISDHDYPTRVGFTLINKALDEFANKFPSETWTSLTDRSSQFPYCLEVLQKYQDPKKADPMMRLQEDLDETKIILHNTIEAVLERGEKLDDLVEKSEGLSLQSKTFYKTAKKTNSCCVIL